MLRAVIHKLKICDVTMTNSNILPNFLHVKQQFLLKNLCENRPNRMEIGILTDDYKHKYKYNNYKPISRIGHSSAQWPLNIDPTLQIADTLQLYNYATQLQVKNKTPCQMYVTLPIHTVFQNKLNPLNVCNIAINTSLSDSFLREYSAHSLKMTKAILTNAFQTKIAQQNVKLNIACISYCKLEGKQDLKKIVQEILYYDSLVGIDDICLCDTYGMLQFKDFKALIDILLNHMDITKINIRLHNWSPHNSVPLHNNEKIIQYCIQNNIYKFDVVRDDTKPNTVNVLNYASLIEDVEDEVYAELAYYA